MALSHQILIRPVITEKFSAEADSPKFVFEVHANANKQEIAREVAKRFKVEVAKVNIIVRKGKFKAQLTKRGRYEGWTKDWKKAIVTLKAGHKIDFFAGAEV
jgi:large subunit ribosomal protein L23